MRRPGEATAERSAAWRSQRRRPRRTGAVTRWPSRLRARPDLAPTRLRATDALLVRRSVDLAGRRPPRLVGRSQLEGVEPRRSPARALAGPRLDRIGGGIEQLRQSLTLVGPEEREDMVAEPRIGRPDPDPEAAELLVLELADDRSQAVVAARSPALAESQLAERQGEVVDDDEDLGQRRPRPSQDLPHRDARVVHEGHGLHEQQVEALVATADRRRGVAIAPTAGPARPIGQSVEHHPADVVAGLRIGLARVAQPDDDLLDLERPPKRSSPPATARSRTRRTAPGPSPAGRPGMVSPPPM